MQEIAMAVEPISIDIPAKTVLKNCENKNKGFLEVLEKRLNENTPEGEETENKKNGQESEINGIIVSLPTEDAEFLKIISGNAFKGKTSEIKGQKTKENLSCLEIPVEENMTGIKAAGITANPAGGKQQNVEAELLNRSAAPGKTGVEGFDVAENTANITSKENGTTKSMAPASLDTASKANTVYSGFSDRASPETTASEKGKAGLLDSIAIPGKVVAEEFAVKGNTVNITGKENAAIRRDESGILDFAEQKGFTKDTAAEKGILTKTAKPKNMVEKADVNSHENSTGKLNSDAKENKFRGTVKKETYFTRDKIIGNRSEVQNNKDNGVNSNLVEKVDPRGNDKKTTEPVSGLLQKNHEQAVDKMIITGFNAGEKTVSAQEKNILPQSQIEHMTEQVIIKIKAGISENRQSSMELSLKPEHLGKVKIQLQSVDGMISIRVIADNGEAINLLNSNLQYIKDNIEQQGIKLQNLEVELANHQEQGNYSGSEGRENGQKNNFPGSRHNKQYEIIETKEQYSSLPYNLNFLA